MSTVLPVAEQLLSKPGQFAPFAATMSASGEIAQIDGALADIQARLREGAAAQTIRASALVYDVRMTPPGASRERDGVAIKLDHAAGYTVVVTFPYEYSSSGELSVAEPFANELENSIF